VVFGLLAVPISLAGCIPSRPVSAFLAHVWQSHFLYCCTGRAPPYDAGIIDEASISFTHRHVTSSRTVLPVLDLAITTRGPSCAADGICETYPWHRHHVAAVQNICSRSCLARYVPPARIDTNTSWYRDLLAVPVSFARLHLFSAVSLSGVGCPISCAVSLVTRPLRCR